MRLSFKNNLFWLLFTPGIIFANPLGNLWDGLNPEMGIYYRYSHIKGKNSYKNFFPSEYNGVGLYINTMFHPNYSAQLSYESISSSVKNIKLGAGDQIFGTTLTKSHNTSVKVKLMGLFLDFNVHFPIDYFWQFLLTAGVGGMQPMLGTSSDSDSSLDNAIQGLSAKKSMIFRLGGGAKYMVTDMLGISTIVRYENTGSIEVSGNTAFQKLKFEKKVFENNLSLNLALFVKL